MDLGFIKCISILHKSLMDTALTQTHYAIRFTKFVVKLCFTNGKYNPDIRHHLHLFCEQFSYNKKNGKVVK